MDTAPEDAESLPGESPRDAAQRKALAGLRQMREAIMKGRELQPRDDVQPPLDWDLHERRLLAMEEIIRTGTTPADAERFEELEQEFFLDYHADMARLMAAVEESMVRNDLSLYSAPFGLRLCHGLAVRSIDESAPLLTLRASSISRLGSPFDSRRDRSEGRGAEI